jgi:hypothetical protein
MKKVNKVKPLFRKVRSKSNFDIYYTSSIWENKEIEGITFIPVTKDVNDKQIHYLRKDNVEYVK